MFSLNLNLKINFIVTPCLKGHGNDFWWISLFYFYFLRYAANEFLMINQNMCVICSIINKKQSSQFDHALQKHHKIKNRKIKYDKNRALLTGFQNMFRKYHKNNVCLVKVIHMKWALKVLKHCMIFTIAL